MTNLLLCNIRVLLLKQFICYWKCLHYYLLPIFLTSLSKKLLIYCFFFNKKKKKWFIIYSLYICHLCIYYNKHILQLSWIFNFSAPSSYFSATVRTSKIRCVVGRSIPWIYFKSVNVLIFHWLCPNWCQSNNEENHK